MNLNILAAPAAEEHAHNAEQAEDRAEAACAAAQAAACLRAAWVLVETRRKTAWVDGGRGLSEAKKSLERTIAAVERANKAAMPEMEGGS